MAGNRSHGGMPLPPSVEKAPEESVNAGSLLSEEEAPVIPEPSPDISDMNAGVDIPPNADGTMPLPRMPSQGIEVFANEPGFYMRRRIPEGEKFVIASLKHLGHWMDLADPKAEKARRIAEEKQAKARIEARQKAGK